MNTKNNKRRRNSIEKIEKTFMSFVETKSLHEITVSDICKEAGINRSTFYSNFLDVFDLSEKITVKLYDELLSLYHEEIVDNKKSDYIKLFNHIKNNQSVFRAYFKLGNDQHNRKLFYNKQLEEEYFGSTYIDYHIEFFRNGFNSLVKLWLFGGCKESPEELEKVIEAEYKGRAAYIEKYFLKDGK